MTVEHLKSEVATWETALHANDSGDFQGSLALFGRIADTAKIFTNVGLIHDRLGRRAEAIHNFTKALEMDKYLAIGYFQRGVSYYHCREHEKALKDFSDAHTMMRGNPSVNYEQLGLDYKLNSAEVLFNQALALVKLGKEGKASEVLKSAMNEASPEFKTKIANASDNSWKDFNPCSLPPGLLYRPTASRMKFLNGLDPGVDLPMSPAGSSSYSPSTVMSDAASTVAPSVTSRKYRRKWSSASTTKGSPLPDVRANSYVPRRLELNQVIGSDMLQPTTEIATIPCAGARISHGPMAGLMAYRFVVRLDGSPSSTLQAVVTNFILDTGNGTSPIPQETLTALGYRGSMKPGTEVTLLIQGVKTKCVVAPPGEAGRVGLSFMTAGSLTYYFDPGLVAPVLYDGSREKPGDIPRTIRAEDMPRRPWFVALKAKIMSIFSFSS
ncbi:hypothetical protein C8J57DRAFT_1396958 [Mycena rebaudengoi]|nr:hypothetical protein C8J57DRAFT_1396958 [Mycena rebaudengoi]